MKLVRRALRAAQSLVPDGGGLTVLAYHLVKGGSTSAVDLPLEMFRDHLDELEAGAEVVPLRVGVRRAADGDAAGSRPLVALTFDDAYRNFVDQAWPLLAERGLPVTLFVPVGFVTGEAPPPNSAASLPAASWHELAALVATGRLVIGSHTWNHPDLTRLDAEGLDWELTASRRELEDRLAVPVREFCYPRGLWSPRLEQHVARVYDIAVIGGGGRTGPRRVDPLRVQRVSLRRDGPRSLSGILSSRLWLEERVADLVRRRRPTSRAGMRS